MSSARNTITPEDIKALRSLLSSSSSANVLTPPSSSSSSSSTTAAASDSDEYSASIRRWSRAAEKPAGVVVVPTSAEDVAVAVKYAREHKIDLAVKGGGHSTAGVSSTNGGLLIDLNAKLRGVTVDTARKVLKVQGGATWADVDAEGSKYGLATVGGTVADTGVGGLVLGGGYGWLSGKHGLSIDCLVEATVVLASGEIVQASESQNADLFWALRGAGQNFGVVTEFVLQGFDQDKVWAGLLLFPSPTPETVAKIVEATNDLYQSDENGKSKLAGRGAGAIAIARPPPAGGQVTIIVAIVFFGSEHEAKNSSSAGYKAFYDLKPAVDTTALVPYPVANTILAPPIGLRASMKGFAFSLPLRPAFVQDILDRFTQFTSTNEDAAASSVMWEIYDPAKVVSLDKPETAGSYANRSWYFNGLAIPLWNKPENDQAYRQWARDINALFAKELEAQQTQHSTAQGKTIAPPKANDKGDVRLYGNYDQYNQRSRDIFGENYPRLQSLKARYDPSNLFDKLFPITPQS